MDDKIIELQHRLLDFYRQHPEAAAIGALID
jgi:hypothetical protein